MDSAAFSLGAIAELRQLAKDPRSGLVFFVGNGISSVASGLSVPDLTAALVASASAKAGLDPPRLDGAGIGFEVRLNDLWQICNEAVAGFFRYFASLEAAAPPQASHRVLASWLSRGGVVVTTNYDSLIERAVREQGDPGILVRYDARDQRANSPSGFETWREDLDRGGALFKLHGSLVRPTSCLGALEHVATLLSGPRADLVGAIVRERPVCFVGWRGADPDIPPLIQAAVGERRSSTPLFWALHSPNSAKGVSPVLRDLPGIRPFVANADELLLEVAGAAGPAPVDAVTTHRRLGRRVPVWPMTTACTPSGMARFVGIQLRRADRTEEALLVLDRAASLAEKEMNSAREEAALVLWARNAHDDQQRAREVVRHVAGRTHASGPAEPQVPTATFGLLSMTIVLARARPWLLLRVPGLLRRYERSIDDLRARGGDPVDVALHTALLELYRGRVRMTLISRRRWGSRRLAAWALSPYLVARDVIDGAGSRSLHSRFDVLAGLAVAAARVGECRIARADLDELRRLDPLLSDLARRAVWARQSAEIERRCPISPVG
jgi:hypothetical protein